MSRSSTAPIRSRADGALRGGSFARPSDAQGGVGDRARARAVGLLVDAQPDPDAVTALAGGVLALGVPTDALTAKSALADPGKRAGIECLTLLAPMHGWRVTRSPVGGAYGAVVLR